MRPDAAIARLSGRAWTAANSRSGSGDPALSGRSWATAFIIFNPASILRSAFHEDFPQTKALATKHVPGKHQMSAGTVSKGSYPPESGSWLRQDRKSTR